MRTDGKKIIRDYSKDASLLALLLSLFTALSLSVQAAAPTKNSYILRYDQLHHPVVADKGMVVSQNELSSDIGAQILAQGGNAIDAAVAVGFSLAVTLPRAGNLGGGGFMLVHIAEENKTVAIDYRGEAPSKATAALFLSADGKVDRSLSKLGHTASTVPGTVAGLFEAHRRWGRLPWKKLIAPAIEQASKGITVSRDLAWAIQAKREVLQANAESARNYFAKGGEALKPGDRWRQPDLAQTLKHIARKGKEGFYRGKVAAAIVDDMKANGGLMTLADLRAYEAVVREPLRTGYRGYEVVTMPPPAGGVHLLQMLRMMEAFPVAEYGHNSADAITVLSESMKRAYAYRAVYLGDPRFTKVPVNTLLSDSLNQTLVAGIVLKRATPVKEIAPQLGAELDEGPDTTHYSVMDEDGNAVANTYTLSASFGSGVTIAGTGILMNNQINNFALRYGIKGASVFSSSLANSLQGGKRPKSTQTPLMVFDQGRPYLVSGTPGGRRIITTMVQMVSNVVDHKMSVAEATHAPRIYHGWREEGLELEPGVSRDTERLLQQRGYQIKRGASMGSVQSILFDGQQFFGAADPRRPGAKATGIDHIK
ncbi:gamma-glutamyltransferase [Pseudomaricurvus alkylphenolicus]|uniref:gamma-glutamyltransferase n=1 Tax=Pseudomaricurvus alkylphenolicus TaxID=1306991 RepID=UPI00141F9508|nr:gamma-glutamyltransferase [Pseudomaricurvus alkylphenolicus]NIB39145.1 gamma-glutamyltransferase [Pseudomaricurvus alkylphenolicus]